MLNNGIPKKNSAHRPLMTIPTIATVRFYPRTSPMRLTMNAIGGAAMMHSPPRTVTGDPHPGWISKSSRITEGATSDR